MNAAVKDSETAEYVSVEYDTLPVHQVGRGQPADSRWHWALCSSGVRWALRRSIAWRSLSFVRMVTSLACLAEDLLSEADQVG